VGVAVDQPGEHRAAAGIFGGKRAQRGGEVAHGPHPCQAVAFPRERGVADGMDVRLSALCATGGENADVGQEWQA
jgi:hypothetical protein